ncbi:hypothetical protein BESB_011260 [Besnoitia besnoiti]|uniref:protein S-acyltransferase n=1 Tax=Besnoitia besnoiti TaxID=94643 RepID=A0A2A9MN10_BESBE|nr:hypothetical protein BESB_011260 [Besnoitia besnoiti]PFH38784.1 hypothetical protein BESB_011260 [Besnoitia besnoiti]
MQGQTRVGAAFYAGPASARRAPPSSCASATARPLKLPAARAPRHHRAGIAFEENAGLREAPVQETEMCVLVAAEEDDEHQDFDSSDGRAMPVWTDDSSSAVSAPETRLVPERRALSHCRWAQPPPCARASSRPGPQPRRDLAKPDRGDGTARFVVPAVVMVMRTLVLALLVSASPRLSLFSNPAPEAFFLWTLVLLTVLAYLRTSLGDPGYLNYCPSTLLSPSETGRLLRRRSVDSRALERKKSRAADLALAIEDASLVPRRDGVARCRAENGWRSAGRDCGGGSGEEGDSNPRGGVRRPERDGAAGRRREGDLEEDNEARDREASREERYGAQPLFYSRTERLRRLEEASRAASRSRRERTPAEEEDESWRTGGETEGGEALQELLSGEERGESSCFSSEEENEVSDGFQDFIGDDDTVPPDDAFQRHTGFPAFTSTDLPAYLRPQASTPSAEFHTVPTHMSPPSVPCLSAALTPPSSACLSPPVAPADVCSGFPRPHPTAAPAAVLPRGSSCVSRSSFASSAASRGCPPPLSPGGAAAEPDEEAPALGTPTFQSLPPMGAGRPASSSSSEGEGDARRGGGRRLRAAGASGYPSPFLLQPSAAGSRADGPAAAAPSFARSSPSLPPSAHPQAVTFSLPGDEGASRRGLEPLSLLDRSPQGAEAKDLGTVGVYLPMPPSAPCADPAGGASRRAEVAGGRTESARADVVREGRGKDARALYFLDEVEEEEDEVFDDIPLASSPSRPEILVGRASDGGGRSRSSGFPLFSPQDQASALGRGGCPPFLPFSDVYASCNRVFHFDSSTVPDSALSPSSVLSSPAYSFLPLSRSPFFDHADRSLSRAAPRARRESWGGISSSSDDEGRSDPKDTPGPVEEPESPGRDASRRRSRRASTGSAEEGGGRPQASDDELAAQRRHGRRSGRARLARSASMSPLDLSEEEAGAASGGERGRRGEKGAWKNNRFSLFLHSHKRTLKGDKYQLLSEEDDGGEHSCDRKERRRLSEGDERGRAPLRLREEKRGIPLGLLKAEPRTDSRELLIELSPITVSRPRPVAGPTAPRRDGGRDKSDEREWRAAAVRSGEGGRLETGEGSSVLSAIRGDERARSSDGGANGGDGDFSCGNDEDSEIDEDDRRLRSWAPEKPSREPPTRGVSAPERLSDADGRQTSAETPRRLRAGGDEGAWKEVDEEESDAEGRRRHRGRRKAKKRELLQDDKGIFHVSRRQIYQASIKLRFCQICCMYQPLRTKHCPQCGRCTRTHDHHCPWIGTCVAEENRVYFYFYLLLQALELLVVAGFYIRALVWQSEGHIQNPFYFVTLFLTLMFCLFLSCMVSCLFCYHTYLMVSNLTTWESMAWHRISYLKDVPESKGSPFDRGILTNTYIYCFPPSCCPTLRCFLRPLLRVCLLPVWRVAAFVVARALSPCLRFGRRRLCGARAFRGTGSAGRAARARTRAERAYAGRRALGGFLCGPNGEIWWEPGSSRASKGFGHSFCRQLLED